MVAVEAKTIEDAIGRAPALAVVLVGEIRPAPFMCATK
jgi:hypothetical protein